MALHAAMNPVERPDHHGNAQFQDYAQPTFTDLWQQQQQQQQQQPIHFSSIVSSPRFCKTNTSLKQALIRASESRALELESSQDSSGNATPESHLLSGLRNSSISSVSASASHAQTREPMSSSAMYASLVMPNNFAHILGQASMPQATDSKDSMQAQQQLDFKLVDRNFIANEQLDKC